PGPALLADAQLLAHAGEELAGAGTRPRRVPAHRGQHVEALQRLVARRGREEHGPTGSYKRRPGRNQTPRRAVSTRRARIASASSGVRRSGSSAASSRRSWASGAPKSESCAWFASGAARGPPDPPGVSPVSSRASSSRARVTTGAGTPASAATPSPERRGAGPGTLWRRKTTEPFHSAPATERPRTRGRPAA